MDSSYCGLRCSLSSGCDNSYMLILKTLACDSSKLGEGLSQYSSSLPQSEYVEMKRCQELHEQGEQEENGIEDDQSESEGLS